MNPKYLVNKRSGGKETGKLTPMPIDWLLVGA